MILCMLSRWTIGHQIGLVVAFCMIHVGFLNSSRAGESLDIQVRQLVQQLGDDSAARREAAEKRLLELADANQGQNRQQVLDWIPTVDNRMPADVRHRLMRIRETIARTQAETSVESKRVMLDAKDMPLSHVLAVLEKQTGNRILGPEPPGDNSPEPTLTIQMEGQFFWQSLDRILDQSGLDVDTFSGEDALAIRARHPQTRSRVEGVCYVPPFRFMPVEVYSQRHLRNPEQGSLRLSIEIAWEPRLHPLRLALPMADVVVIDDRGGQIPVLNPAGELDVPVQHGYQAIELQIPIELPDRSVQRLATVRGEVQALVPGRTEEFRFNDLTGKETIEKRRGGVVVTLDRTRKNNAVWEIYMRLRFDEVFGAFASHLGWMLQNETYLMSQDGVPIPFAGYETISQTDDEIGLAYLFELPEDQQDLRGMTWVYKTPAAIVQLPLAFDLHQIVLP